MELLTSDMAKKVLAKKFRKKWYVDGKRVKYDHPLYSHFKQGKFPPKRILYQFPDTWEKLPLLP